MNQNTDFQEWMEMCVKLNHINSFEYNEFTEHQLVGEGRFACVKSAMMNCDVKVALKSLKVDVVLEKDIIEKFVNEVDNRYGQPPFASHSHYLLPSKILNGERENKTDGTPEHYVELYQKCWDTEPINRPNAKKVFKILKIISSLNPPNRIPEISSDDETSSDEENDISFDNSDIDSLTSDDSDDKENMINILNDLVQLYSNKCKLGSSESDRNYENWFDYNMSNSRKFFIFLKKNTEIVEHHEFILGKFYQRGFGVKQNNAKYFKWMERGTRKDDKLAYFELSKCYFFGKGVNKDNGKAYELYNRSNRA
ncbi:14491_t:CDS:2 [Funneliformis mosseae]|uniref:14491_t:CDS:1 n=1 Tax=Funneliformis mosseae TaxID=27381 RepID=A0A9N9D710_FUNMO|nr:14491_t:CDS:2 [Funneliformis mosseae]